jgi:acyl-CoA synthetase (AMP-forming)/AMP-acid ligase II
LSSSPRSLWQSISAEGVPSDRRLHGASGVVNLADLARGSSLGGRLGQLRDRTVLLAIKDQLTAALAMIELDGLARRMILCPPDLATEHLHAVISTAGADACVRDAAGPGLAETGIETCITVEPRLQPADVSRVPACATEWILLTSGTSGAPKLVQHDLESLTHALAGRAKAPTPVVWSTFYDIRRYGGLQIFLRALSSGSLVLSDPAESVVDFVARAAAVGVTHISGTPSHWRKALMSGAAGKLASGYVRLSGEIADQAILDSLRAAFPNAIVAHAFASTEAGVAFEVRDGLAGFPSAMTGTPASGVELQVVGETLRIRSGGNARRYLGEGAEALQGPDGYVDTGDLVELHGGRYYFMGRRGGVINVGGLKVYPEEIEAVINAHPWVRMSLVKARRSPITGAVVAADLVLADEANGADRRPAAEVVTREVAARCRQSLAAHKVPTVIRIVPALEVSPSGKLVRPVA